MGSRRSGPLRAYRIADTRWPVFDGAGAERWGGRWNSPGRRVIYASLTFAGALLERLALANIGRLPKHQRWIAIDVPRAVSIEEVEPEEVPGWDLPDLVASRAFGDAWYDARRSCALVAPALVGRPVERNAVINQVHPEFRRVKASRPRAVEWDERLMPK